MNDRVQKYRIATGRKRKSYILIVQFSDGQMTYQIVNGDGDTQPYPVMVGQAEVNRVMVEFDSEPIEVGVLRLHVLGAEHLSAEAADVTSPRLLGLFPDVLYYVYGDEIEVYEVATGLIVGHVSG